MKKGWKILIIIDTALIMALSGIVGYGVYVYYNALNTFSEIGSLFDSNTENGSKSLELTEANAPTAQENTQQQKEPQKAFEDDYIKVSFVEWYEEPAVDEISYLRLLVENKSDKNIMVYLKDVSVNNLMVNTGSGVPMVITPGKASQQPFIMYTEAAGINSVDEISEISFKVVVLDNDTSEILEESVGCRVFTHS